MKPKKKGPCPHPPERNYSWVSADGYLCVGCCDCGKTWEKKLKPNGGI